MTNPNPYRKLGHMPISKPIPHVLVTLDLDAPAPRWVVGYLDLWGRWHVIVTRDASAERVSPRRRVKIDGVVAWLAEVFTLDVVTLRRLVDAPAPTWQIKTSTRPVGKGLPFAPAPRPSCENDRDSPADDHVEIYPGWL